MCIHVCVFLVIWPGQFKRPVMYYDDSLYVFVVAKNNKLKHEAKIFQIYWDARKSSFDTRYHRNDTGSTSGTLTLSITQPYMWSFCRAAPQPTAESEQRFNSVPWRKDVKS